MKQCPACRSELPDRALACPNCGGSYQPDGSFRTPWDVEMAKQAAERERKVGRAERFGALGKPHTDFFLEKKSGSGCVVAICTTLAVMLFLVMAFVGGCGGGTAAAPSPRSMIYTDSANGFQLRYAAPPFARVAFDHALIAHFRKTAGAAGLRPRLVLQLPDGGGLFYAAGPVTFGQFSSGEMEDRMDLVQRVVANRIGLGKGPRGIESCTITSVDGFEALTVQFHGSLKGERWKARLAFVFGPAGPFTIAVAAPASRWIADLQQFQPVIDSFDMGARAPG